MSMGGVLAEDGEFAARWSVGFEDLALLNAKARTTRLGFAAQLTMYRATARFGRATSDFSSRACTNVRLCSTYSTQAKTSQ